jgi:pSer/pThr/pTyr-binding forkhead associated (FHA) protein
MTYFEEPVAAVRAAVDMQRALAAYNETHSEADQMRVRIGLNYGPGLIRHKDVQGDIVNVAGRIIKQTNGEQIMISASLEEKVRSAGIPCQKMEEAAFKGKAEKIALHEVCWREVKSETPVQVPTRPPTMAARAPVAIAAEPPKERGTAVFESSPVAELVKRAAQYSLVVVRPDGSHGQACRLDKPVSVLGRIEGDIVFPDDPLVSRRHARFSVVEEGLAVEDLKSANGIFWRLRSPYVLQDGDIILLGRQMFRFRGGQPASDTSGLGGTGEASKAPEGKPASSPAELIRLLPGGVEENHYPLEAGENVLGRTRGNLTFPEDAYLSSQHARVTFSDGTFVLEDLRAANGTFVGLRGRVTLTDGDIILIGHQLLRITATPA